MAIFNGGGASGVSPQKFETDIGEVKELIQDVDSDVAVVDGVVDGIAANVGSLQTSMGTVQTSVGNMQNTVNSMSGTINTINTNVSSLINGRVVKSAQRGFFNSNITGAASKTISISTVTPSKSLLIIDGLTRYGGGSPWVVTLNSNNISLRWTEDSYVQVGVYWTVVEFY